MGAAEQIFSVLIGKGRRCRAARRGADLFQLRKEEAEREASRGKQGEESDGQQRGAMARTCPPAGALGENLRFEFPEELLRRSVERLDLF